MHRVTKNNCCLARLRGISVHSNVNYKRYNFQAFANISRNFFAQILNFPKIHNPKCDHLPPNTEQYQMPLGDR